MKKRILIPALFLLVLLCGCVGTANTQTAVGGIVCTTQQLANLTERVLDGTAAGDGTEIACVVTEPVSCLHDYTLSVRQMQLLENAAVVIESGMGLEDFMADALRASHCTRITASAGVAALPSDEDPGEPDPHIWLAPKNCAQMAQTIADGLAELYPEDAARLRENAADYAREMDELQAYGEQQLSSLSCRQLVTFHDGFSYFADAFGLEIAAAMEVEAGSEPSARELEEVVAVVRENAIPAVFSEANGTQDAAQLVARETGAGVFVLDMGLSNPDAIRNNIDTVKEALQ